MCLQASIKESKNHFCISFLEQHVCYSHNPSNISNISHSSCSIHRTRSSCNCRISACLCDECNYPNKYMLLFNYASIFVTSVFSSGENLCLQRMQNYIVASGDTFASTRSLFTKEAVSNCLNLEEFLCFYFNSDPIILTASWRSNLIF